MRENNSRDLFVREQAFGYLRGTRFCGNGISLYFTGRRDTGYGVSHFSRDTGHGIRDRGFRILNGTTGFAIRDFAFCTVPRDNPESRTTPGKALKSGAPLQ